MGGYNDVIGSVNLNNSPMCDFNTWYQTYYPFYAQMAKIQSNPTINTSVAPNFRGTEASSISQLQQSEEPKRSGSGGKFAAILSAAALIGGGIACYRRGGGGKAKGIWERIVSGFNTYKKRGLNITKHKLVDKGVVNTLPEGTTEKAGVHILNNNGKKQVYRLIANGENKGKYQFFERTRRWFWQS